MTIETPGLTPAEKRREALVKARKAKAEKAKAAASVAAADPSSEDVRAKRAKLLEELANLPQEPAPVGVMPGTLIKDGLGYDKVPWTPNRLREACNKNEVIDGVRFEWKEILGTADHTTVSWNGIVYKLFTGVANKVPSVHYAVYMQALEDERRERARWAPPTNVVPRDGYQADPHLMGVGPLEPRGE